MFLITNLLKNFKIAFQGFRGFGPDTDPVSLKELTLFTGKNGSGKSTFVKLLQMMSNALNNVHSMKDLMNLEINIGTDILGGSDHLLYGPKNKNPRWVFSLGWDNSHFYEGHLIFKVQNRNKLIVDSFELYGNFVSGDTTDVNRDVLARWTTPDYMSGNWNQINEIYIKEATTANVLEAMKYYILKRMEGEDEVKIKSSINLENIEQEIFNKKFEQLNVLKLDDVDTESIASMLKNFPGNYELYEITPIGENSHKPFHTRESKTKTYGLLDYEYLYINSSAPEFKIVKEDIWRQIRKLPLKYKDKLEYFINGQKAINNDFDFAEMLIDKANFYFDSVFINTNSLESIEKSKLFNMEFYINGPELVQKYFGENTNLYYIHESNYKLGIDTDTQLSFDFEINESSLAKELDNWYEENGNYDLHDFDAFYSKSQSVIGGVCNNIIKDLMKPKYEYFQALILKYQKIYEQGILDFVKFISGIAFQSNVVYGVERTYNIYKRANQYSKLINFLDYQEKGRRDTILENLNKYLSILGIDKKLSYHVKENAGFIYLDNHGRKINLIDEGSGISKVIGLLFFILENLYNMTDSEDARLLVLEEPESNLHPSLQSKLADLFIDVLKNNNIRLLIETHSEYLIRRLQYLVATNEIEAGQVGINYFQMKLEGKRKRKIEFYEINIGKDGRLSREFGPGFFDEADNLSVELFLKNKNLDN